MGRQGTLQGMLGSTHTGQEGFKKWIGKAGQTALALAVCIFLFGLDFFFGAGNQTQNHQATHMNHICSSWGWLV